MILRLGSTGPDVERLQRALDAAHFDPSAFDGVFGPDTETAVKRFQAAHGLLADGVVGDATMAALGLVGETKTTPHEVKLYWEYVQETGNLYAPNGTLEGNGWAGHGAGRNNPAMQNVHATGPLPVGWYTIGPAHTHPHLGPMAMPLIPDADNEMFDRSAFFMHGASLTNPVMSSDGCIIEGPAPRAVVSDSYIRRLRVVAREADRVTK